GAVLAERRYYSVGGGFVVDETTGALKADDTPVAYPFRTSAELLDHARSADRSISGLMLANELSWRGEADVRSGLLHIWSVMQDCVDRGCRGDGVLPGGLKVRR